MFCLIITIIIIVEYFNKRLCENGRIILHLFLTQNKYRSIKKILSKIIIILYAYIYNTIPRYYKSNLKRLTRFSFREYKSPHRILTKIGQETLDKILLAVHSLCDRLPFNASSAAARTEHREKVFSFSMWKREKPVTGLVTNLNRRSASFVSEIKELDFPTRHRVQLSKKW